MNIKFICLVLMTFFFKIVIMTIWSFFYFFLINSLNIIIILLQTQKEYQFVGTGNLQECQKNIESLFSYTKCSYQHCSFNNVFQPLLKNVTFLVSHTFSFKS